MEKRELWVDATCTRSMYMSEDFIFLDVDDGKDAAERPQLCGHSFAKFWSSRILLLSYFLPWQILFLQ